MSRRLIDIDHLRMNILLFLVTLAGILAAGLTIPEPGIARTLIPIPRKVLILYDSAIGQSESENLIIQNGQVILNYYGLLTEYRDVNNLPLPSDEVMDGYRGIITMFTINLKDIGRNYLAWIERQIDAGRKLVVIGRLGITASPDQKPDLNKRIQSLYQRLGFNYEGDSYIIRPHLRFVFKDNDRVEFERKYPPLPISYEKIIPIDDSIKTYLAIERADKSNSTSSMVFTGPFGGYAHEAYLYWEDPITFRRQWYVEPFIFFAEAFAIESMPSPDPTTLNGKRVAFSHIDGDGFAGVSRIDPEQTCADIIRDQILKKYNYPVTVSVIVGEIDPKAKGNPALVRLAKEIFRLPNVEPASHSYSHPFYWNPNYQDEDGKYDHQYGIYIPGYTHDPEKEIDYSMEYITKNLSPRNKPCRVFLWTGNCVPMESDIGRCDLYGYYNMNGGDTIFDDVFNSYTSVAPLYKRVGKRIQVFTGQANENILTNLWEGPYYGFKSIITTMKRTEHPKRVTPLDVYYHFYSGEYKSSLKALQSVYDWAMGQDVAKVFTSDYLRMMEGYLKAKLSMDDDRRYIIQDYGDCLTIRLNDNGKIPDLSRSTNVLGYVIDPQGLYVSLAPGKKNAAIALMNAPEAGQTIHPHPHVRRASGWIKSMHVSKTHMKLIYSGFGSGKIELGGMPPGNKMELTGSALDQKNTQLTTSRLGRLIINKVKSGSVEITWR